MDKISIRNTCYQECAEGTYVVCYCTIRGEWKEVHLLVTTAEQVELGIDKAVDKHLEEIVHNA